VTADQALADAERAGHEIGAGYYRGVLHGVPVAIKDLFWTKDAPAAAGMTIYRDYRPCQDATAVARLRDAGAVILGKLQMTEGAYSDHHPSVTGLLCARSRPPSPTRQPTPPARTSTGRYWHLSWRPAAPSPALPTRKSCCGA
jgi:Asp-tRNA(Asn)/Glu-tRNA(Gln) amidotransferase A subunit family amidase